MTELEDFVDGNVAVLFREGCAEVPIVHVFEWPSKNVVGACLTYWKKVSEPFDSNDKPRILFLKGRTRKAIDGSFIIGDAVIKPMSKETNYLIDDITSFNKFIDEHGGEKEFSRSIAEAAVWSLFELSNV